jgi:hypothetical protein
MVGSFLFKLLYGTRFAKLFDLLGKGCTDTFYFRFAFAQGHSILGSDFVVQASDGIETLGVGEHRSLIC